MAKTLVGVFDDTKSAASAIRDLKSAGVPSSQIHMTKADDAAERVDGPDWTDKVSNWFSSLFDDDADRAQAGHYAEAYRRGHVVVTVDVDSGMTNSAVEILNRYGTVDLEQRAETWKKAGWKGFDRSSKAYTPEERQRELAGYAQQQAVVPVVQEELQVGKRVVQRGGVRVHSYVQERPVEEVVRLRDEKIDVSRRPVNRAATPEDLAFKSKTVSVTALGEEAVVGKSARVVEEVVVGKHVESHDEAVHETLRRKDVKVEPAAGASTPRTNQRRDI